ncbi:MAG: cation:proton antiporter [Candidatus Obscuribacterales bacterium]|nr:cation:proton antiporter [Candidatus Obscuribacterales bacterium]
MMTIFRKELKFSLQTVFLIVTVCLVCLPVFAADSTHVAAASAGLSEHSVLLLFLDLAVLLLASLVCGEVMVRFGQPAIIGQILAGVLLGQTVFGNFFPAQSAWLFPQEGNHLKYIESFSWIGVSFVLMLTGMETDVSTLKRLGKPALYFALYGFIGPLLTGAAISFFLPDSLITSPAERTAFAVLLGAVFAAASVAVVGKVLMDMKLMQRDIGLLVVSAALSHDLLCCLLLAAIAVLSGSGSHGDNTLFVAIGGTLGFAGFLYFGRPLFFNILRLINDKVSSSDGLVTAMVALLLLCAASTEALGVHIVLGAFAAGVILSKAPVISAKVVRPLEVVTMGFFAPIFFASAALKVNMAALCDPQLALITAALCLATVASKALFCCLAGKYSGIGPFESLSVSFGANTKGSMGIILAMLGYALNIITINMMAVTIFISLFTTAIAPTLLKWGLSKVLSSDAEKERIARLDRQSRTILGSIRRVLWPTSGTERSLFIAKLLGSIGEQQVIETTILFAKTKDSTTKARHAFKSVSQAMRAQNAGFMERTVSSENVLDAIVSEASKGYDLIVMSEDDPAADARHVFGPLVDSAILETSTRCLVVYVPEKTTEREIKQVIVPVRDSELSLNAGEFGISLAKSLGAEVTCLSIDTPESVQLYSEETRSGTTIERNITAEIAGSLTELSKALDVPFSSKILDASLHPAAAIVQAANESSADLIVLGAEPKLAKGLFLGHTINYVLRHAPCAVVVLKL